MSSSTSGTSGGGAPIWLTVIVARIAGGFVGGLVSSIALTNAFAFGAVGSTGVVPRDTQVVLLLASSLISALCTGVVLVWLLPMMSGRTIGLFQAALAALCGSLVSVIVVLALTTGHAFTPGTTALILLGGASLLISVLTWLGAVAVTTWMVTNASVEQGGMRFGESAPYYPYGPFGPGGQRWSDIEAIDRTGRHLEDDQAERGYWGGLEDDSSEPGEPPPPEDPKRPQG